VTSDPNCQKKYDPVYKLRRVACYAVKRDPHMYNTSGTRNWNTLITGEWFFF